MTLSCEPLESRDPAAVLLDWVFRPGDQWLAARESVIRAAGDSLAARLTPLIPLAPLDTPFTPLDLDGQPLPAAAGHLPADTLRVYVGSGAPAGTLAGGAAGGYTAQVALARTWGGVVWFDTRSPWDRQFDLFLVSMHEVSHAAFGVDEHNPSPGSLMNEFAPFVGESRRLDHTDLPLFRRAGWDAAPQTAFGNYEYVRVLGIGVQDGDGVPDGWAYIKRTDAAVAYSGYVPGPDPGGDSYALWPPHYLRR